MTTPAQQAVFDAYQAYAAAYRRAWGPDVAHWDKQAQDARYQRYLARRGELDAANDAAKRAREALIASGDPWPAALFSYDAWLTKPE